VLGGLGTIDLGRDTVDDDRGLVAGGTGLGGEGPSIEDGVAEVSEDGAVVLIGPSLEVVVLESRALILGGEAAGNTLIWSMASSGTMLKTGRLSPCWL